MRTPNNTFEDLLKTKINSGFAQIHCPKCGTGLTLQTATGVRPILSPYARQLINDDFAHFRGWIRFIAECVNRRNIGLASRAPVVDQGFEESRAKERFDDYKSNGEDVAPAVAPLRATGLFKSKVFVDIAGVLKCLNPRQLDVDIETRVAPLRELESDMVEAGKIADLVDYVLVPIEASERFAVVPDIVTEQVPVQRWVQKTKQHILKENNRGANDHASITHIVDHLRSLVPNHFQRVLQYLQIIGNYLESEENCAAFWSISDKRSFREHYERADGELKWDMGCANLLNRCERACFLVALFTMHDTKLGLKELDDGFTPRDRMRAGRGDYMLPDITPITFTLLKNILLSHEVVSLDILNSRDRFKVLLDRLKKEATDGQTTNNRSAKTGEQSAQSKKAEERAHKWFLEQLEKDDFQNLVKTLFGFACNGRPSQLLKFNEERPVDPHDAHRSEIVRFDSENLRDTVDEDDGTQSQVVGETRADDNPEPTPSPEDRIDKNDPQDGDPFQQMTLGAICGWYPKSTPTYGVLLLGAPGSGKSFAFLSGGTIVRTAFDFLGSFSLEPDAISDFQLDRMSAAFRAGREPMRTERTAHHALQFKLSAHADSAASKSELHFVFVDIPGEVATQNLREGVTDSIVSNTLSTAHIVVMFLDFSTCPVFAPRFLSGPNASSFNRFRDAREKARGIREDKKASKHGGAESLADVKQVEFVRRMATMCQEEGDSPYILVVVPKADLYADDAAWASEKAEYFLHSVFTEGVDRQLLLVPKLAGDNNDTSLDRLTSFGGSAWKNGTPKKEEGKDSTKTPEDEAQRQVDLLRWLSNETRTALCTLGNVLREDEADDPEAGMWDDAASHLSSDLERMFGPENVFFLPTSAQGRQESAGANIGGNGDELPVDDNADDHDEDGGDNDLAQQTNQQLGHPQKLCEFLFLGPMMLAAKHELQVARTKNVGGKEGGGKGDSIGATAEQADSHSPDVQDAAQ